MRLPLVSKLRKTTMALACGALAMGVSGCYVDDYRYGDYYYPPVARSGTAVFDWTVAGTKDPRACNQFAAAGIQISLVSTSGRDAGTFSQSCSAFATEIVLAPDDYVADAFLVDPSGYAATTTIAVDPFRVFGNDRIIIPIDFPADSFFPGGAAPVTHSIDDAGVPTP